MFGLIKFRVESVPTSRSHENIIFQSLPQAIYRPHIACPGGDARDNELQEQCSRSDLCFKSKLEHLQAAPGSRRLRVANRAIHKAHYKNSRLSPQRAEDLTLTVTVFQAIVIGFYL